MPAAGWTLRRFTPPSHLHGANGLASGPDGRLYIAQGYGGRVGTLDPDTGVAETVIEAGTITAPDDIAFDAEGTMYVTDTMPGAVWRRSADGVIDHLVSAPGANGITCHGDRIFVDECLPSGRLLEVFPDGRKPRTLAERLVTPNALAVGPDEHLYVPLVGPGEIVRVPLHGGTPEVVFRGLATPTAVKFDATGALVVSLAGSGELLRFDLANGGHEALVTTRRGIDNFAFVDGAIVVSNFVDGGVLRRDGDGTVRELVAPGLIWPFGLAWAHDGLWLADGLSIAAVSADGTLVRARSWLDAGFPGLVRGIAAGPDGGLYLTSSAGDVAWMHPTTGDVRVLSSGHIELIDLAVDADGAVIVAEAGRSRVLRVAPHGAVEVLATGLASPSGVTVDARGAIYVGERAAGRVQRIDSAGDVQPIVSGLVDPQGLALLGDDLIVLEAGRGRAVRIGYRDGNMEVLAGGLPLWPPSGVMPRPLIGVAGMIPGPLRPFAGLATGPDGTISVAATGDGSVLSIARSTSGGVGQRRSAAP